MGIEKKATLLERVRAAEQRGRSIKFMRLIAEGRSEGEICEEMGVEAVHWEDLRRECLDCAVEQVVNQRVGDVYVEYVANQRKCISDIEEAMRKFSDSKQYSAVVAAVKAKSEIFDKVIKMGQDFGLLQKTPERKEVVAGVFVAKLDDEQLRNAIVGELTGMEKMMRAFGGKGLLELEAGGLHREEGEVVKIGEMELTTGHKSRSHVLSSGRRVVKKEVPM